MAAAGDGGDEGWARDWSSANDAFHRVIVEASGNERLPSVIANLHQSFPRSVTWVALAGRPRLAQENVAQHAAVRAALERGDAAGARRAMVAHVQAAGELVAAWFERHAQEAAR